jgi:plasmid maintenance system antidote protein VapI
MIKNGMRPTYPGEILREIVKERRGITPDTALRLPCCFDGDALSWINLQTEYDLQITIRDSAIERDVFPHKAA